VNDIPLLWRVNQTTGVLQGIDKFLYTTQPPGAFPSVVSHREANNLSKSVTTTKDVAADKAASGHPVSTRGTISAGGRIKRRRAGGR
jgi:hypothetical protein